jgi:YVTN family beta-propeller protein
VANSQSGTVTVIDGATNATATVTVGNIPTVVAVNPVTNQIYVANTGSNTLLDLGLSASPRSGVESSAPSNAARDRRGQTEERWDGCQQDRRLPRL